MRIDIMTLFPDLVDGVLSESIIGRARENGYVDIRVHNIRDYSEDKHHRVDDAPYGGGRGMLMAAPPIYNCYASVLEDSEVLIKEAKEKPEGTVVIYMSPKGRTFNREMARRFSSYKRIIILCGHYEGVDQRIIDEIVDEEVSIGDFVLTGGEIPACIITDSICRFVPGVLPSEEAYENESFEDDLLEYPQYTRPAVFRGREVPKELLSGHHANIKKWRQEAAFFLTKERRPDLLEGDFDDQSVK